MQRRRSRSPEECQFSLLASSVSQNTYLERLLESQNAQLDSEKRLGILTSLQPIRYYLHNSNRHLIPELVHLANRPECSGGFEDVLLDDEESDEVLHQTWERSADVFGSDSAAGREDQLSLTLMTEESAGFRCS